MPGITRSVERRTAGLDLLIEFERQSVFRRGGRVAEGAPLLREYGVNSSIEGSNPSLSAIFQKTGPSGLFSKRLGWLFEPSMVRYVVRILLYMDVRMSRSAGRA